MFDWLKRKAPSAPLAPAPVLAPIALDPGQITHRGLTPLGYWADPSPSPRLLVITGAGISAESGLSTFRDPRGLWTQFDPQVVCNFKQWRSHVSDVHRFHDALRAAAVQANPNPAHQALASLNDQHIVIATQNVDGLLERAGARDVLNLHGRLDRMACVACAEQWSVPWSFRWADTPIERCPFCAVAGGIKPGVVFFHEPAPLYRPLQNLIFGLREQDAIAILGTAGTVLPLRQLLTPCVATKWLLNLEAMPDLPARLFDNVAYGPATELAPELAQWWRDRTK